MSDPLLTKARRAVWDAIGAWPALQSKFQRRWRFEDNSAMFTELTPTLGDLPALAIFPASTPAPEWVLSQTQSMPYTLDARMWTRQWSLLEGEELWEQITRALFGAAPPGEPTYIFQGTGHNGVDLGPLSARHQRLAKTGVQCIEWRWSIGLRLHWTPSL